MAVGNQSIPLLRRPGVNVALRGLAVALSVSLAMPSAAAQQVGQRKSASDRKTQTAKQARKPAAPAVGKTSGATAHESGTPAEAAPAANPIVTPQVAAIAEPSSPTLVPSPPMMHDPDKAADGQAVPYPVNPYLAGWFRPTPVSELPNLAAQQLGASTQWAIQSVISLPGQVVAALPSIKRVFPTGGRELWVANVRCPAEMVTGQYFFPANALRDAVNGLLGMLNESQLLTFDIQLVCS